MRVNELASGYTSYAESHIEAEIALTRMPPAEEGIRNTMLSYFPVARMNPYQSLLYQKSWDHHFACVPCNNLKDVMKAYSGCAEYVHLHWVSQALRGARNRAEAEKKALEFCTLLDDIKTQNKKIIWSVHNALPHGQVFESQEVMIRNHLCDISDKIHILTKDTPDFVSQYYTLPEEKLIYVPHPAYQDCYADFISYEEARFELGIAPDEFVFLFFGSIQNYKGLDVLLAAFPEVRSQYPQARLVIAGKPVDKQLANEIQQHIDGIEIKAYLKTISEREVQYLYKGTNVSVYPYKATLNSGAAMLSLQFGQHFIGPDAPGFREISPNSDLLYNSERDQEGLTEKMLLAVANNYQPAKTNYQELLAERSPAKISDLFFSHLQGSLEE